MFDPNRPHNALPRFPIQRKLQTEPVLEALIRASSALSALKEAGKAVPNPSVVLRSMVLQEAKLSSEIENIVTTNDELYRQIEANDAGQSPTVREVRRYSHALWKGYEELGKRGAIDLKLILDVASEILESGAEFRNRPGTRIGNLRSSKVVYTPPEGPALIQDLLSNMLDFANAENGLHPLVRIAAAHYQFEAIHPFPDGNGRTGRVLNVLFMVHHGLLDLPVLYLSQEFLTTRAEYYRRLREVTETGAWEPWLLYFIECVETTALITKRQFEWIRAAQTEAQQRIRERAPRTVPADLAEIIFRKPFLRIRDLVEAGIAKRQTAAIYLRELEKIGLLESRREWREALFLNRWLLNILSLSE